MRTVAAVAAATVSTIDGLTPKGAVMTGELATDILTSTTFELPGYTVDRTLGMSWGLIVRSVGLTKGLTGGLRALKAGEVAEFTEVVDHARRVAMERLVGHAQQLGGNAVLGVRFDSSDIGNGLAEVVAYGTAAIVQPT